MPGDDERRPRGVGLRERTKRDGAARERIMARKTVVTPEGDLTPAQHELLTVAWDGPPAGMTVAEIWQTVADRRGVTRTTVLNLVDRLEKRGWLTRALVDGVYRYRPTLDRAAAEARLAAGFMAGYFGGSPTQLVQSLLGSDDVSSADIDRLAKLVAEAKRRKARGGERPSKGGRT
jgi:BlaI family penicillinase repressor